MLSPLCTLVEWVAHCTKVIGSIPEGDQKGYKYTCFARSVFCTGGLYDLYALVVIVVTVVIVVFVFSWKPENKKKCHYKSETKNHCCCDNYWPTARRCHFIISSNVEIMFDNCWRVTYEERRETIDLLKYLAIRALHMTFFRFYTSYDHVIDQVIYNLSFQFQSQGPF